MNTFLFINKPLIQKQKSGAYIFVELSLLYANLLLWCAIISIVMHYVRDELEKLSSVFISFCVCTIVESLVSSRGS